MTSHKLVDILTKLYDNLIFLIFQDLVISYDNTVRTSTNEVVQFLFGDDGLDPSYMEARDGKLLDFSHLLNQVKSTQK